MLVLQVTCQHDLVQAIRQHGLVQWLEADRRLRGRTGALLPAITAMRDDAVAFGDEGKQMQEDHGMGHCFAVMHYSDMTDPSCDAGSLALHFLRRSHMCEAKSYDFTRHQVPMMGVKRKKASWERIYPGSRQSIQWDLLPHHRSHCKHLLIAFFAFCVKLIISCIHPRRSKAMRHF